MKIELLAIDLDGTLLNSAKRISGPTAMALRRAADEQGVRVVLASARPPRSVMPFHVELNLDTPMINYNGALVYDPSDQRVVMHRPLPLRTARRIVRLARASYPRVLISAEILDRWYTDRTDQDYATETARQHAPDLVAPIDLWLTEAVTKLLLLGDPRRLSQIAEAVLASQEGGEVRMGQNLLGGLEPARRLGPALERQADQERFAHEVAMIQTEDFLLQIMHPTVSKALALRTVAAELAVPRERVMAIGDNANDVGMLQWAGVGVAVANAAAPALAVANLVTADHDDDGVAKAVHQVILQ